MEHLRYCLEEISTIQSLLEIKNDSFFKRSLARHIAVRVDDFIKLGFKYNKQAPNSSAFKKAVKDDLNALQEFYKDFFKKQRDKFGAHFQDLALKDRLQVWKEIDLYRVEFFATQSIAIYQRFSTTPGYLPFTVPVIPTNVQAIIKKINEERSMENFPSIGSDILALTRPNSGGILHYHHLHTKAGVLKAIELLLDYNLALLREITEPKELKHVLIKNFIIDLVSYCDNLYTRRDVTPTDPQYELGLDAEVSPEEMPDGFAVLSDFKNTTRFDDLLSDLRKIRNKTCGHLDSDLTVAEQDQLLVDFDLEKFTAFYDLLKRTFRKLCSAEISLGTFLIDPEPIPGALRVAAAPTISFEGSEDEVRPIMPLDQNDPAEYTRQWEAWQQTRSKEACRYFRTCFGSSAAVRTIEDEVQVSPGHHIYKHLTLRSVHTYFEDKLRSAATTILELSQILDLFINCNGGHTDALAFLLRKTYPADNQRRRLYLNALGFLAHLRREEDFDQAEVLFASGDFYDRHAALLALFRIDLSARNGAHGVDTGETTFSSWIKSTIRNSLDDFETAAFCMALASELFFGKERLYPKLKPFFGFFESRFKSAFSSYCRLLVRTEGEKRRVAKIAGCFGKKRFITLVAMAGDFFKHKKHHTKAQHWYSLGQDELVQFSRNNAAELHNLGVIAFKMDDLERAVSIARHIIGWNPERPEHYALLLNIYLKDLKYQPEFDRTKKALLSSYILSPKEKKYFEALQYEE